MKNHNKPKKPEKKKVDDELLKKIYQDLSEKMKERLSTKVTIVGKGDGAGKIEIEFYNNEDLERLMDMMGEK